MYFPYLRSNTNEVLALCELAPKLASTGLVVPLFNVINANDVFASRVKRIIEEGQKVCVIVNTAPADQRSELCDLLDRLDDDYAGLVLPGLELSADTTDPTVKGFAKRFTQRQAVVVHRKQNAIADLRASLKGLAKPAAHVYFESCLPGARTHAAPSVGDVIVKDGFAKALKNGLYPPQTQFPTHLDTYMAAGFSGFGDFAAIGDHYKAGGGKASNVALHLTERLNEKMICNHFVSDDMHVDSHIHFQYEDALDKLKAYVGYPIKKVFRTDGVVNGYLADSDFHGLGLPKRWSLKHHLERVENLLIAKGAAPFI